MVWFLNFDHLKQLDHYDNLSPDSRTPGEKPTQTQHNTDTSIHTLLKMKYFNSDQKKRRKKHKSQNKLQMKE